jgi:ABC-type amino acid transport substrate-binding protein
VDSALVIAKKDAYHSFDDLKGKRIGMENGTTHQKYLQDKHPDQRRVGVVRVGKRDLFATLRRDVHAGDHRIILFKF